MPFDIKLEGYFGTIAALAVFLGAVCGNTVSVTAQSGEAWFGLDMPKMREQQSREYRMIYQNPDIAPLSLRLPEAEDPYLDITGAEVHRYLQDIMDITTQYRPEGTRFWGRIAGSEAEKETAEYMARQFQEFGLEDAHTEPVQGQEQWWPLDWEVTLIGNTAYGSETKDVTLTSAFPALQLKTGALTISGLEAELIHVGRGHAVDLVGREVSGKIAVIHAALQPDPFFQSARGYVENAIEEGALGVLTVMDVPGNHQNAIEDMGPPDTPSFILGGDDGRFLEDVMAAAGASNPPKVRISLATEVRDPWQGKNVVALVPGRTDEYVVLVAHLDGYFHAANDNGGGLATILALAKHYSRSGAQQPKRNMLFVGISGAHEFGDGLEALMAGHPDIMEKIVLVYNVSHPSSVGSYYRGPLKFYDRITPGQLIALNTEGGRTLTVSNGNPLLIGFHQEAIDRYGLVINSMVAQRPTGDAFGFYREGHTVVQILDVNLWYHSSGDRIDTVHPSGLQRATRLYAYVLDKIDGASSAELERSAP